MAQFRIRQNGWTYASQDSLDKAIALAQTLLNVVEEGMMATFVILNEDNVLVASISNRRIIGTFSKLQWGGRAGDDAIYIGTEDFDATDEVLLMPHSELLAIQDSFESTDELGRSYIQWPGPCEVAIVKSICGYFGVDCLEQISESVLAEARSRVKPRPRVEVNLVLDVSLTLRVAPGGNVDDFLKQLDVLVISNTTGVSPSILGYKQVG